MRTAGIREARQHLTALLEDVRKGREVTITDRGRPVACLVPPRGESQQPLASLRKFRATIRLRGEPLGSTVSDDREDRW